MTTSTRALPTSRTAPAALVLGLLGAITFAALTWIGALIRIPLEPVPITLQTLFVLLAGAMAGRGFGSLSQLLYVGGGMLGLPILAGGAVGWGVLAGPTGGYLLSFLVVPPLVGWLVRRSSRLWWHVAAFTLATAVIFAMGVAHLALFFTHNLGRALAVGLVPFLPGAVFKIVAATSIYRSGLALVRHRTHPRVD